MLLGLLVGDLGREDVPDGICTVAGIERLKCARRVVVRCAAGVGADASRSFDSPA